MEGTGRFTSDTTVAVFAPLVYDSTHSRKHAIVQAALDLGLRGVYVERPSSKSPYAAGGGAPALNRAGKFVRAPDGPEILAVPKKRRLGPVRFSLGKSRDERARGRWLARAFEREVPDGGRSVAVVTSARWWPAVADVPFDHLVYDKNDEPRVLRGPLSEDEYLERERGLLDRVDLLVGPSRSLLVAGLRSRPDVPAELIRNGVEWDVFMARKDAPVPELEKIEGPVVGFLGTVASWIDTDLIADCAAAYPDFHFPVIGSIRPSADVSRLGELPNVALWGPVPFSRVPSLMNRFDVCLVPFRPGTISESACPVKFFEYLSLGKPIVCTPMPELADLSDLCRMTRDGFVPAVGAAAEEDDGDLVERRKGAGREFGWDRLFRKLLAAIP